LTEQERRHDMLLRAIDLLIAAKRAAGGPEAEQQIKVLLTLRARAEKQYAERKATRQERSGGITPAS
jgi:hypothetical protein